MSKVILFGATGHAGRAIAAELDRQGHVVTAVVRDRVRAGFIAPFVSKSIVADVLDPLALRGICNGQEVVVSALGKSVSPFEFSKPTFQEVDFQGNMNILDEAKSSGVGKFVYLSAFGSEGLTWLNYFRVHHEFSQKLQDSGLDYAIVQPPAIMSAFLDLITLARRGMLSTIGSGESRTNPISEEDLARVCVDAIRQPNGIIAAGGKAVYTRRQIDEIVQNALKPGKKVRKIPAGIVRAALPFWKILNRNLYDKLAFFLEVTQHDVLAPRVGETSLEEYVQRHLNA